MERISRRACRPRTQRLTPMPSQTSQLSSAGYTYKRPANPCRAPKAQEPLPVSPFPATLTHSLSRKSFACHSYANTRDGCPTPLPISAHSSGNPILLDLYFHGLTNPFSRNPFPFTSIQNPRGVPSVTSVPQWQIILSSLGCADPNPSSAKPFGMNRSRKAGGRGRGSTARRQNKREMYSRIMCFQYGQSWPPCSPQLSSEWRMPFPPRISDRRYDGPEFSHCPVPVAI
jgi:hypothetical protein